MLDLVCEGACNPDLEAYDDVVERLHEARETWIPKNGRAWDRVFTRVSTLAKALAHTPHVKTPGDPLVRCQVCGHTRPWFPLDR